MHTVGGVFCFKNKIAQWSNDYRYRTLLCEMAMALMKPPDSKTLKIIHTNSLDLASMFEVFHWTTPARIHQWINTGTILSLFAPWRKIQENDSICRPGGLIWQPKTKKKGYRLSLVSPSGLRPDAPHHFPPGKKVPECIQKANFSHSMWINRFVEIQFKFLVEHAIMFATWTLTTCLKHPSITFWYI